MSMYNMLFGVNKTAPILLKILDIDQPDGKYSSGRFRDCFLNEDGTKILLYTRNGGGNRRNYQDTFDTLGRHPNYITDYDDDFDCTYATIEFNVPTEWLPLTKEMMTGESPKTVHERFTEVIREIQSKTPEELRKDDRFKEIISVVEKIAAGQDSEKRGEKR